MNRGYAFGFLIVILVVVLGFYVAFTGFLSSREILRARSTPVDRTPGSLATRISSRPASTVVAASVITPTEAIEISAEVLLTTPIPIEPTPLTVPPAPVPTQALTPVPARPSSAPPQGGTVTPVPMTQPPTPIPSFASPQGGAPAHQFRLAGPPGPDPNYPNCCYIFGTVRDAAGNGLEGVQVKASNEWNPSLPPAPTKGGNEAGQYNIPLGYQAANWDLIVVDGSGNQISTKAQIPFDPNVANGYRVDWQRTY